MQETSQPTTVPQVKPGRRHRRKSRHAPPGTAPGSVTIPEGALPPQIRLVSYDAGSCTELRISTMQELRVQMEKFPAKIHWVEIRGFGDAALFLQLADYFKIHRLQLEDVFNVYQRPKVEEYQGHLFLITRRMSGTHGPLSNDQVSLFLGKNYVISIQDSYDDYFEPLRIRIQNGKGNTRKSGADYLLFALMDVVVDNYFPLLEHFSDKLDDLQEALIDNPTRDLLNSVMQTKRELIVLRRTIWGERDKMNDILRSNFQLISDSVKIYFRDSYDHCIHILDLVESYKEVTASLMDVYMSSVSNRMNQVMKVLTIISTIFIPLTFIVGIYGMNFAATDPSTGESLPYNMPELYSPYGYVTSLVVMAVIVIGLVVFFIRKGWLSKGS